MTVPAFALEQRTFVPIDAEPSQLVEDDIDQLRSISVAVGVFDAEHERAARRPGKEPIEERSTRTTDMQKPRG